MIVGEGVGPIPVGLGSGVKVAVGRGEGLGKGVLVGKPGARVAVGARVGAWVGVKVTFAWGVAVREGKRVCVGEEEALSVGATVDVEAKRAAGKELF